jgi:hypothetical protein
MENEAINMVIELCRESGKKFHLRRFKLRCDDRFTHAFTACGCVFKEITLVGSNLGNNFENATACSKRKLKTTVATQLYKIV